jgi:hypothetical protein
MTPLCQRIIDADDAGECILDESFIVKIQELVDALPTIRRLATAMRDLQACSWLDEEGCESESLALAKAEARAVLIAIKPIA